MPPTITRPHPRIVSHTHAEAAAAHAGALPVGPRFRVVPHGLNVRSRPNTRSSTRLVVLPQGETVVRLGIAADDAWWRVAAVAGGQVVEGYVAHRFLQPASAPEPVASTSRITAVHLREGRTDVTRDSGGSAYAYPLGERGRPSRGGGTPADRARELGGIIDWLQVERRARYRPVGGKTYCNIYATDYCYLAGAYLPRVWWTQRALVQLLGGELVTPRYDATVREMNANQLYDWFVEFGDDFGWHRVTDPQELQGAANAGEVGIICAQRADLDRSGHIVAVVPETGAHRAVRGPHGLVPLQSQAGVTNFRYGGKQWWTGAQFRAFGLWRHA